MNAIDGLIEKACYLREQGAFVEARKLLEERLTANSGNGNFFCLLGQICGLMGDHLAAVKYLEAATELLPDTLEPVFMLGVEYENFGKLEEALACFEKLRDLNPEMALPLRWIGSVLFQLGRLDESAAAYHNALQLAPDYGEALIGLARLLIRQHRTDDAEPLLKQVLKEDFRNCIALNDLSRIYRLQGRMHEAVTVLRYALKITPSSSSLTSNLLYDLCNLEDIQPEELAQEHFKRAALIYPDDISRPALVFGPNNQAGHQLHIAYMSGDFRTHSVAAFIEPILASHSPSSFKIYCYSNVLLPDETTHRLKGYPVVWREIYGHSAASVVAKMREDKIDILVELSGHTSGNRLDVSALRPAPVQVSWIGYPHSCGMRQIDYYISDRLCDPEGATEHLFCEQIYRLPRIFCVYFPPQQFPPISSFEFSENNHVTFGSFNSLAKINDQLLYLWAEILQQVPESRLLLKGSALAEGGSTHQRIVALFAEQGVSAERIGVQVFKNDQYEHLEQYSQVDIALDTYPYHGTTTTCEALWMGVPVVTLAGRSHVARVGVSLLNSIGLSDLIAKTPQEYVDIAVRLSNDSYKRGQLRKHLRMMMATSPLMDAKGVTLELEHAYRQMVGRC